MSSISNGNPFFETWTETTSHVFNTVFAANRAAFAFVGILPSDEDEETILDPVDRIEAGQPLPEWHVTRSEQSSERLGVGDQVEFTKTITDDDVRRFAAASGDTNPLHLDDEFASHTRFGSQIVHGTLVGGLISAALARLPGLPIYFSQNLEFHSPACVGDRITAECVIVEDLGDDQYRLTTQVVDDSDVLLDGEAIILIDDHPTK